MLRFADSFDHYGTGTTGRDRTLAGAWAEYQIGTGVAITISNDHARTGTYALKFDGGFGASESFARLVVPGAAMPVIGVGFGVYVTALPSSNDNVSISVRDNSNARILTLCLQSDGSIALKRGSATGTLIEVTDSVLTAGTYHHIEFRAFMDDVVGEFELRVNGVVRMNLGSLDLGVAEAVGCSFGRTKDVSAPTLYWDDIFVWDEDGAFNNTFLGPLRILTTYCDGDGSPQDWTPVGTATAYEAVNQTAPDDDTTYIGASTVGDVATLTTPSLPPSVDSVAAVYVPLLGRIDESGTGQVLVSIVSSGDEADGGVTTPLTSTYTYWPFIFNNDPHGDVAWNKTSFEAAVIKIEKTL